MTWTEERKVEHGKIIKERAKEGVYAKSDEAKIKISKSKMGQITAWDTEKEEFVCLTKEQFEASERFVGTTAKATPAKKKPKKPIQHVLTGQIFEGVRACLNEMKISSCVVYRGLKTGEFIYCE